MLGPARNFVAPAGEIKASILVVDDDPRNLFAMEEMLGDLGHELITASSGKDALRCLMEHDVALILMDVQMPELDGYETVELIRTRERCRHVPIIFVTAFSKDEQQVFRGYSAGAVDYVFKPIDPVILRSKVSVFIDLFHKTEEIRRQAALEKALLQENFRVRAEKLRADQALRQRDEQYALVINSLPVVLYTLAPSDSGIECRFISENVEAITGFSAERFIADPTLWPSRLHPDDRERVLAELADRPSRGSMSLEYRWLCADGTIKYFLDRIAAMGSDRGHEIFGTWLDVTDRRQLEIELQRAQRLEAIGRLTGGIAHDFNNMLSVVIGSLDMLRHCADGNPDTEKFSGLALKGALRCADLTQRLLTFARRQPLQSKRLDLGEFVTGMMDLLGRMLGDAIEVDCRAARGLFSIFADPAHVEAALLNLVFNARDAMPEGGRLTVEVAATELAESLPDRPAGGYVTLRVGDDGEGMSPETLARAFEPFFTTKGVGRGTGLGLSTTYGFLKQLGGHVDIDSRLGEGTAVTLWFPVARESDEETVGAHPGEAEAAILPQFDGTVLVVEDEDDVRNVAVATLNGMGAATLEAKDGAAALALIDKHAEIKIVFTDVMMPGMNGKELSVHALAKRPDLKIVFTSGYGEIAREGEPTVEILQKPYRPQQLVSHFQKALAEQD